MATSIKSTRVKELTGENGETGIQIGSGMKIVVPNGGEEKLTGRDYDLAVTWLGEMKKRAEEEVRVYEIIDCFPLEGAYGLLRALQQKYGWARPVPTPGFFGDNPPTMVGLEIGVNETINIPWGRLAIPGIDGYLEPQITQKDGRSVFVLGGKVRQKNMKAVRDIADLIRAIVTKDSIYRGKAIRVRFNEDDNLFESQPRFLDTTTISRSELIFSDELLRQVEVSIWTPIEHTAECRSARIPLKRGVLLEGPYGTGKTLVATVTAGICEKNGWTFVYLDDVRDLAKAIQFAASYSPAVIFGEDVDKAVEGAARTDEMNTILNTIDGMDTKSQETMVVLTTNHLENINQAMLRPGRLDAVVSVRPPDAVACQKLIRLYGRHLIDADEDLTNAGRALEGQIPAVIREVVERAKLAAISHLRPGATLMLKGSDLEIAAEGMLNHLRLLQAPTPEDRTLPTALRILGQALGNEKAMIPTKIDLLHEGSSILPEGPVEFKIVEEEPREVAV